MGVPAPPPTPEYETDYGYEPPLEETIGAGVAAQEAQTIAATGVAIQPPSDTDWSGGWPPDETQWEPGSDVGFEGDTGMEPYEPSFWEKHKTPIIVVGVLLGVGVIAYLASRKRK